MTSARLPSPPRPLRLGGEPVPAVGRVRMYVCGITPYDMTHLGQASTYLWADAADRVLTWAGHTVSVARNVTDVDDVLYAAARQRGQEATLFGALQRASFEATMTRLGVRTPDAQPTAAGAVGHVVQLATVLLARDAAYIRDGTVYARTSAAAGNSGLDRDEARRLSGEFNDRPEDPDKDDPLDVALWRRVADPADIAWSSPWGPGRPGWHAECAAMVLALYGPGVDLHCGGADLVYPHHACETVLAETATGVTPFARAWLRAGTVGIGGAKMSKSTGNLVLVDDLLREHSPAVLRLACLDRPWAQGWAYEPAVLDAAAATLEELHSAAARSGGSQVAPALADALLDGLDVAGAVRVARQEGGATARTLIEVLALT